MPLTLEEQERRAYICGNVVLAAALAHAIDGIDEKNAELEEEVADLKQTNDRVQKAADDLEEELHQVEEKVLDLRGENEDLKADVTLLRSRIAELEGCPLA